MIVKYKNREVEIEISGYSCDEVMIECGTFVDTGEEADESVLDYLQDIYSDEITLAWHDKQIDIAEAMFEGNR